MNRDEQARQKLVEIALETAAHSPCPGCRQGDCAGTEWRPLACAVAVRRLAGFRDPSKGHWCAAGLTAAMEDAGLLVPAPGTPARRGAIALLDFVANKGGSLARFNEVPEWVAPGDIIAWKQNPEPAEWLLTRECHAFAKTTSERSMCGKALRSAAVPAKLSERCSSCVWETRKGHVALIVKVDEESVTTVGWNEGASPGRVMMRQLWRDSERACDRCDGRGWVRARGATGQTVSETHPRCPSCKGKGRVSRSSTVLWRRDGGLYGITRPVAA